MTSLILIPAFSATPRGKTETTIAPCGSGIRTARLLSLVKVEVVISRFSFSGTTLLLALAGTIGALVRATDALAGVTDVLAGATAVVATVAAGMTVCIGRSVMFTALSYLLSAPSAESTTD